VLGVPCLTIRESTERPITVALGTNRIVGTDVAHIVAGVDDVFTAAMPSRSLPPLWDGLAAERIVEILDREVGVGRLGSPCASSF
jgi:UDP-N-acetylglucosamine 2-epimerase (non-hydrolysing)